MLLVFPVKVKKQFVGAYIDAKVKEKLDKLAKESERSLSFVLEKILSRGVTHREKKKN